MKEVKCINRGCIVKYHPLLENDSYPMECPRCIRKFKETMMKKVNSPTSNIYRKRKDKDAKRKSVIQTYLFD